MKVLLDTNVVLDVMLKRPQWFKESLAIWEAHQKGAIVGCISATAITDIFYLVARSANEATARKVVKLCLTSLEILPVNKQTLILADSLTGRDFEDNVQIACVQENQVDAIVTRDIQGFKQAGVPVYTPAKLSKTLRRK